MQLSRLGPGDWITAHARHQPEADCLVRGDGSALTYREIDRQVTRLAHALRARGIGKGDRLAVLAVDSAEYVVVLLACMKLATTFVALNYRLSSAEIHNLLRASEPRALFFDRRYAEVVAGLPVGGTPLLFEALLDGDDSPTTFRSLLDEPTSDAEVESVATDDDILSLALTSGTTGVPKGVLQSQRMIKAMVVSGTVELGFLPTDLIYSGAPLFHVSGIGHVLYGLARGAASLVLPQFDAQVVLRWLQSGRLRHALLIPSMIISLLERPDVERSDYAGLRSIMYGGAPMSPAVLRRMVDVFDCDLYNGFGAGTEAGGQCMFRPEDHRRALDGEEHLLGSIGRPAYGNDIRICDSGGHEVPDGEIGEIYGRSDSIMSGYVGADPAQAVRDGWFHAGDFAWRDKDGYLFLAGRADDMIIRGGENVYPVEIEDVLAEHPAVAEAAVVGQPDSYWGETVVAFVRTAPGAELTVDAITAHCRARLAGYKVPARLVLVDELPHNPTGKVLKTQLRHELVTGRWT